MTLVAACVCHVLLERTDFAKHYMQRAATSSAEEEESGLLEAGGEDGGVRLLGERKRRVVNTCSVVYRMWPMIATVFNVFFMTFLVFPGVVPSSTPYQDTIHRGSLSATWWNAILLLVFNLADTTGRSLAIRVVCKGVPFLLVTFLRYATIVVFYGCAHNFSSPFFNDITLAVTMAIFAISNGYMSSCA